MFNLSAILQVLTLVLLAVGGYGLRLLKTGTEAAVKTRAEEAVIHGGHANGLIVWKNKDGKTLKELESV